MTPEQLKAGIARTYGPRGGAAFCRDTGINRSTLWRWEAGEKPIPKWVGLVLGEEEPMITYAHTYTYATNKDVLIRNYMIKGNDFTIPKGSCCSPCDKLEKEFWLSPPFPGVPSFYKFDAVHYGVRVKSEDITRNQWI